MSKSQGTRNQASGWRRPSTASPLWTELSAVARQNGWVLQRALNPSAERRRGRYFLRDYFVGGRVIHGAASLRQLQVWLMATPEQRLRSQTERTTA